MPAAVTPINRGCYCEGDLDFKMIKNIALIGTTSSGKSTIANLLSSHFVLPSGVQETTTLIVDIFISNRIIKSTNGANGLCLTVHDDNFNEVNKIYGNSNQIRQHLEEMMMLSENRDQFIRLDLTKENNHSYLFEIIKYYFRCFLLKRQPIHKILSMPDGFFISDFPGFKYEFDNECLSLINRRIGKGTHILFVFNAEETDSNKEYKLLLTVCSLLRDRDMDCTSISFVMNRKEVFFRDDNPEDSLNCAIQHREKLIQKVILDVWKDQVNYSPKIIPISAAAIFATEMLCWHYEHLSSDDSQFLTNRLFQWSNCLLPKVVTDELPRATIDWNYFHWMRVFNNMYQITGLNDLILKLKTVMTV